MKKRKLEPEVRDLIAAADEVARRYGHALDEEHVLLVAASKGGVGLRALTKRGVSMAAVALALEGRIGARADGGYRGALPGQAELEALLDRALLKRRLWLRFDPLELDDVIDAALDSPALCAAVAAARFDAAPVLAFVAAAEEEAGRLRHRTVLAEHALLGACRGGVLRTVLEKAEVPVEALTDALSAALRQPRFASAKLGPALEIVASAYAHANVVRATELSTLRLVVELLRNNHVARSLAAHDIATWELIFAIAHGRTDGQREIGGTGRVQAVLHDDAYTTMDHVVKVLVDIFELSEEEARASMLTVHEDGSDTIGTFEAADARDLIAAAREMSRLAGMPLRISLLAD